ncbi:MAG TPA: carbon-nitrogen family hydrolase [Acidimicrobiales bacterium]
MSRGALRIAAIQHDIVWLDREANFARLAPKISEAAENGAELVVLAETFSTGFAVGVADLGEPEGGPSSTFLAEQARRHGVWLGGSCPELPTDPGDDRRPWNTFVVAGPDGETHRYRKIHPFTYAGEDEHFRAGEELVTVDIAGLRVSLFVCYDLRFADEFWQLAPRTDVFVVPANWPATRSLHWRALLQARAIENQAYVVGVNRVGEGGGLLYAGDSCIIDPLGEVLVSAGDGERTVMVEATARHVAETRSRFPFMSDRR